MSANSLFFSYSKRLMIIWVFVHLVMWGTRSECFQKNIWCAHYVFVYVCVSVLVCDISRRTHTHIHTHAHIYNDYGHITLIHSLKLSDDETGQYLDCFWISGTFPLTAWEVYVFEVREFQSAIVFVVFSYTQIPLGIIWIHLFSCQLRVK